MAVNNNIVSAPVGLAEVAQLVGSVMDVVSACKACNRYSRIKPYKVETPAILTYANRRDKGFGNVFAVAYMSPNDSNRIKHCGETLFNMIGSSINSIADWTDIMSNNAKYYQLSDYDGYFHSASNPFYNKNVNSGETIITTYPTRFVYGYWSYNVNVVYKRTNDGNLRLHDLTAIPANLITPGINWVYGMGANSDSGWSLGVICRHQSVSGDVYKLVNHTTIDNGDNTSAIVIDQKDLPSPYGSDSCLWELLPVFIRNNMVMPCLISDNVNYLRTTKLRIEMNGMYLERVSAYYIPNLSAPIIGNSENLIYCQNLTGGSEVTPNFQIELTYDNNQGWLTDGEYIMVMFGVEQFVYDTFNGQMIGYSPQDCVCTIGDYQTTGIAGGFGGSMQGNNPITNVTVNSVSSATGIIGELLYDDITGVIFKVDFSEVLDVPSYGTTDIYKSLQIDCVIDGNTLFSTSVEVPLRLNR